MPPPSPPEPASGIGDTPAEPSNLTFEQAMQELDTWVRRMESGELGLDEAIAAYRRAASLAAHCQARLQSAEREVKVLEADILRVLDASELRGGGGSA